MLGSCVLTSASARPRGCRRLRPVPVSLAAATDSAASLHDSSRLDRQEAVSLRCHDTLIEKRVVVIAHGVSLPASGFLDVLPVKNETQYSPIQADRARFILVSWRVLRDLPGDSPSSVLAGPRPSDARSISGIVVLDDIVQPGDGHHWFELNE